MIIVREVFTAKPGQASKLAKLFKKMNAKDKNVRIMTDLVGEYNTVIMETEMKNLAEFEKMMQEYKSGKQMEMNPDLMNEMANYHEMFLFGKREIFNIE